MAQRDNTNSLILPGGSDDDARRRQNLLRRKLLSGRWLDELLARIDEHFDDVRSDVIGRPTMSRNLGRTVIRQMAVQYDQSPAERNEAKSTANDEILSAAHQAGIWQFGTRLQQRTLFIREGLRGMDVVGEGDRQRLLYRHVNLDQVWMEADPDDPDQPRRLIEGCRRTLEGKEQWTWNAWDISEDSPRYAVLKPKVIKDGQDPFEVADDITDQVYGPGARFEGANFKWLFADGRPFMPYTLYHAERTGHLYDSWEGIEVVDGTLDIATLWTFWLHNVKDASWPQRYVLNAILRGEAVSGGEAASDRKFEKYASVPADPSSIMQFFSDSMTAAHFGQWMPGSDPNSLELAISSFERNTAAHFNLTPSDFQTSGDAESGYALSIKRQAVREAQRRNEPQFRRGDEELLAKSAAMSNRAGITSGASEEGWELTYPSVPMSPEERRAAQERITAYKDLGMPASRIWQVQQLEQVDRDNALEILIQWQADEKDLEERLAQEGVGGEAELSPDEVASMRALIAAQRAPLPGELRGGDESGQGGAAPAAPKPPTTQQR